MKDAGCIERALLQIGDSIQPVANKYNRLEIGFLTVPTHFVPLIPRGIKRRYKGIHNMYNILYIGIKLDPGNDLCQYKGIMV